MQIGKYIGYAILIIAAIFVLEWFQIVDVPFFEIPDFMSGKKDMIDSTKDVLEQMKWKVAYRKMKDWILVMAICYMISVQLWWCTGIPPESSIPHLKTKNRKGNGGTIWGIWKEKAEFLTNPAFINCLIFIKVP